MAQEERQFIVSVKEGKPQWDLLGVPGIENLPAVHMFDTSCSNPSQAEEN